MSQMALRANSQCMAIWYQQNFQTKTKYIQDSWYRLVYGQSSKHASVNSSGPANVGSVILQRIWSVPSPIALGAWKLLVFVLTLLVFPQFHSWIESRRTLYKQLDHTLNFERCVEHSQSDVVSLTGSTRTGTGNSAQVQGIRSYDVAID